MLLFFAHMFIAVGIAWPPKTLRRICNNVSLCLVVSDHSRARLSCEASARTLVVLIVHGRKHHREEA